MFRFVKQIIISAMMFCSSLANVNSLECISMKNQDVKEDPKLLMLVVIILYFTLLALKQINEVVICNDISDPYARICVPDDVKNLNVKVFSLMSLTNE